MDIHDDKLEKFEAEGALYRSQTIEAPSRKSIQRSMKNRLFGNVRFLIALGCEQLGDQWRGRAFGNEANVHWLTG